MTTKKTNWKKEYNKLKEDYDNLDRRCDDKWEEGSVVQAIILFIIISLLLFTFILWVCGAFDSVIDELDLDKDELVKEHIMKYYPEYKDCNIKYYDCLTGDGIHCNEGVKIYCDKLENRDGLKVSTETEPTEILYFDDITLKDILMDKINKEYE